MDSKYSLTDKNKSNVSESNPFSSNLKRRISYGSPSTSLSPPKKPHLQNVEKISNPPAKQTPTTSGHSSSTDSIQMQRKKLPVYAVRDQYVYLSKYITTILQLYNELQ